MINSYVSRIELFIENVKANTDISHLNGPYKSGQSPSVATWQDKAWQYSNQKGEHANFFFCLNTTPQTRITTIDKHGSLPSPWHELLKAYTLELLTKNTSPTNKRKKVAAARDLIINSNLFSSFSPNDLLTYWERNGGNKNITLVNNFIKWLKSNKLIPSNIPLITEKTETNDGSEEQVARKQKLPNEKVIMAMGAIHHEVIPWDKTKWNNQHPLDDQRSAFTCTMFALSMSSPNRAVAEQTVLNMQTLKTQKTDIDGIIKTVHYLDWPGSKGFDDNKNHIVYQTAPVIGLDLDYLSSITEPNRIIARFYKRPEASLKELLKGFIVNKDKWRIVNPNHENKTNLFILGYLLGLYDRANTTKVLVTSATQGANKETRSGPGKAFFSKHISALNSEDEIAVSSEQLGVLFAINRSKELIKRLKLPKEATVEEIQNQWLKYLHSQFPLFPKIKNDTDEGVCDVEYRLYALNSYQLGLNGMSGGNDYVGSNSPFSIISPATMGKIYANDLNKTSNTIDSIFTKFGFDDTFYITPHQLRHYMTDTADRGGLPIAINNMWGGRKDLSQIVHYIHTSHDNKASVISDILYSEDGKSLAEIKKSLRITTIKKYEDVTNESGVASITSSGICTQNLMVTPCTYLNDLNTQCVGCSKSCHIAHDETSVSLLEKDLILQEKRLADVRQRPQFNHSKAMQDWFEMHLVNTEYLRQLIELMNSPDIETGSLIRMLADKNEFRISNLRTRKVEVNKLALPNTKEALQMIIDAKQNKGDDTINQLLELF
ncbi:MAG: hypothetical protein HRU18_17225 [Pseudoalteromonas sp.]|uniref:hypothetical protein n=1 Tax=Pseudoalteromonas sp. TaxID=53249 RepID=UPI001C778EBF|nr:hypothetical protein [Pseudoalteromonas sp.]NRA79946.1 hypothetical protein [Pseudoalteromonas sp.]QWV04925.1 hypothetical protein KQ246_16750 [Pseudoalteromonas shioyasakiensis]